MLTALGIEYEAVTPEVEELSEGRDPEQLVVANARSKAEAGLELAGGDLALGVDTEVLLDGRLLGKAVDEGGARERLEALSGRTHEVLSGVCLAGRHAGERTGIARSLVTFATLDPPLLDRYIASGEWRDRAGAYAIQGLGSVLVKRLEGDFSNVVGLPLQLLLELAPELFSGISSDSARGPENT